MQRHRLALLLGILVALVFFYLGLNTWMESQQMKVSPPPVVRAKPPVQTIQRVETVKPEEPKPEEKRVAPPESLEAKAGNPHPDKPEADSEPGKGNPERKEEAKAEPAESKALKDFVVQIGAFKDRKNAESRLKKAKERGYDAFIIEEEGLYKVRVRVKASSVSGAVSEVKRNFKGAFVVR
ncbi:MAG: SPOR domain-containing protein [Aquificota bacterium]|nr:SPOR domain-containing protein [Aquificota bacterium]